MRYEREKERGREMEESERRERRGGEEEEEKEVSSYRF